MDSPENPGILREPLAAVDHAWLRMDEPSNLMIINGVLVMDEPVAFDRVRDLLGRRLLASPASASASSTPRGFPAGRRTRSSTSTGTSTGCELPAPGDDERPARA